VTLERADCGAACLPLLSGAHGAAEFPHAVDEPAGRRIDFVGSSMGVTVDGYWGFSCDEFPTDAEFLVDEVD
jgi:hypothetical protein